MEYLVLRYAADWAFRLDGSGSALDSGEDVGGDFAGGYLCPACSSVVAEDDAEAVAVLRGR